MVIPTNEEALMAEKPTPSSPSRRVSQSRLHNFSFPTLNWGNQRLLRCMNLTPTTDGERTISTAIFAQAEHRTKKTSSPSSSSPLRLDRSPHAEEDSSSPAAEEEEAARPWNLRTRRAACNAPSEIGRCQNPSSSSPAPAAKLVRLRSEGSEKVERPKFSLTLSKEEIAEDFLLLKGGRLPRRPKKRAKNVQRQLDSLFPGMWLSEITLDSYKVDD